MISTPEEQKTLALGFLGVGWIGRNRMEMILEHSNAKAGVIVEPSAENAAEALKIARNAKLETSYEAMVRNNDLDGIVIATPSAMHAEQSVEALKAGKAVFCQKPLGRTAAEVEEVVRTSAETNKLLAVDLSYRYVKAFQEIQKLITEKGIGDIYAVDLVFHNAYGPDKDWFYDISRSGGGCVMDLGIHLVDLGLWALGFPGVENVTSRLFAGGAPLAAEPGDAILAVHFPRRPADDLLEVLPRRLRHGPGIRVGREERRPHRVDPPISGLGAQHGDHEALEGVVEVELGLRVRIGVREDTVDLPGPAHQLCGGLAIDLDGLLDRLHGSQPTEPLRQADVDQPL